MAILASVLNPPTAEPDVPTPAHGLATSDALREEGGEGGVTFAAAVRGNGRTVDVLACEGVLEGYMRKVLARGGRAFRCVEERPGGGTIAEDLPN